MVALRRATFLLYWSRAPGDRESAVRLAIDTFEYRFRTIAKANRVEDDRHFDGSSYRNHLENHATLSDLATNGYSFAKVVVSEIDRHNTDGSPVKHRLNAIRDNAAKYLRHRKGDVVL